MGVLLLLLLLLLFTTTITVVYGSSLVSLFEWPCLALPYLVVVVVAIVVVVVAEEVVIAVEAKYSNSCTPCSVLYFWCHVDLIK